MKNQVKPKRRAFFLIVVSLVFVVGICLGLLLPRIKPNIVSLPARTGTITPAAIGISYGDSLVGDSPSVLATTLNDAVAVGITTIRIDLSWVDIQPISANVYNWTNFDRVVTAAGLKKLTVLPILDYTPAWAREPGCMTAKCEPANPAAFAAFAAAAVSRYAPMGVHTWEIWNEPNTVGFWQPAPNAAKYVNLLMVTTVAMRAADPRAYIVSGGLAPAGNSGGNISQLTFFSEFANLGGISLVDAIGYHSYSYPALPAVANWNAWQQMNNTTPSMEGILIAHSAANKKIWITEYGAPTNGPGPGATIFNSNYSQNPHHVDEALQAEMANDSVRLVRSSSYIGALYWYTYKDLGTSTSTIENFFGLRRFNGTAKPAWVSLQKAIKATN